MWDKLAVILGIGAGLYLGSILTPIATQLLQI